jgi:hypothetical protein
MCPKAAMSSAELNKRECSKSKSVKKSKQRALRSAAAWTAGAGGTDSWMALDERPRTRLEKALAGGVGAADMVAEGKETGGNVLMQGAM